MSPLARALLALAAAALLHAACAAVPRWPGSSEPPVLHCTIARAGDFGDFDVLALELHVDENQRNIYLPESQCPQIGSRQVGTAVRACDWFGSGPSLKISVDDNRANVICTWHDGQICPEGLDVQVFQLCKYVP